MLRFNVFDAIALILVMIGALNWGLVGISNLDLIALLFGKIKMVARVVYILIGLAGVWLAFVSLKRIKR